MIGYTRIKTSRNRSENGQFNDGNDSSRIMKAHERRERIYARNLASTGFKTTVHVCSQSCKGQKNETNQS
jgi:hypothetical protein